MIKFFKTIIGVSIILFALFVAMGSLFEEEYGLSIFMALIALLAYLFLFKKKSKKNTEPITNSTRKSMPIQTIGKYKSGTKCFIEFPIKRASGKGIAGLIFTNKYLIRFYVELKEAYYDSSKNVKYKAYCYDADFGTPGNWTSINQLKGYNSAHEYAKGLIEESLYREMRLLESELKF